MLTFSSLQVQGVTSFDKPPGRLRACERACVGEQGTNNEAQTDCSTQTWLLIDHNHYGLIRILLISNVLSSVNTTQWIDVLHQWRQISDSRKEGAKTNSWRNTLIFIILIMNWKKGLLFLREKKSWLKIKKKNLYRCFVCVYWVR